MIQKYTLKVDRAKTTQRRRLSIPEQIAICSDKEYEVLLLDEEFLKHIQISNEQPLILFSITERELNIQSIAQDNIVLFHLSHVDSPWNREIKTSRMLRKIYEQDCILKYTENSYENINKTLDELKHNRLDIVAESIYINLFLSTIRQEYIILREYELIENVLHENVNRKLEEIVIIKQKIQITSDKVNAKTEEISKLHNQIRDICFEYMNSISDNKFRNFLCRIFKKKYKELKREDDSITSTVETSSDASNSPNDESDTFHLDENVCPPGCSKQLYDLTFLMREKRYAYEHRIKDVQQTVEILSKEIEIQTKKLKVVESILNKNENDLKIFMVLSFF
ncbi:cilia- and flagella-associated protein 44-like [Ooceraea biroi]|uniref:cilia- and flagella-associated protein 44-like n=1 Tax=Ooceraea biroi TaxID=2015173 RepID=UPI000F09A207|nr:cilia- and flagella-associated protein 44-like [Ooceraea biroi]